MASWWPNSTSVVRIISFPSSHPLLLSWRLACAETGPLGVFLLYSFYYLCAISYCHKHRGKRLVMHFSLMKVSKHDFGEGIVPCPATFCMCLTAAARLVEHTDHKFNQSWPTAEPNYSSFSFSSGWKKHYGSIYYLYHSLQYIIGYY